MGMNLSDLALGGLLWGLGAYVLDVPVRRALTARKARRYADMKGKPLLNVGAGTQDTAIFGKTLYGDVNVDLYGRKDVPHGTEGVVTYSDAQNLSDFSDGQFGAVMASHLLEHLPDPHKALGEFKRVTGDPEGIFIVTPSWWAPHTWLHPGHLWYATDGQGSLSGGKLIHMRDRMNPLIEKITTLRDY